MSVIPPPAVVRLRFWHLCVLVLGLTAVFRIALPAPRTLTADEADTLRGGHRLVDLLTAAPDDARLSQPSAKARLLKGFETAADHPRLPLVGDNPSRRAVLEAPLPRWLAALGIGVLPVTGAMTNLERAATASALAVSAALGVLLWTFRRRSRAYLLGLAAIYLGLPPVWEASASAGYGAAGLLAGALFIAALERLLRPSAARVDEDVAPPAEPQRLASTHAAQGGAHGQNLNAVLLGLALGLCLGVHPFAVALAVTAFVAWAVARPPETRTFWDGHLRLPSAPVALFLVPVVALVVLVLLWPSLWAGTGKRLGAYLLDTGTLPSPGHTVLGALYDQAQNRSAQAWTALLQWVAWTPIPVLLLWVLGFARAWKLGRAGAWAAPIALLSLLFAASVDGGLFGGRLSLLPLLIAPTVLTAAEGFDRSVRSLSTRAPKLLPVLAVALIIPFVQVARGSTFGLARSTGAELRHPVPVGLLDTLARLEPGATVGMLPTFEHALPALDAAFVDLELDLEPSRDNPRYFLVLGSVDDPRLGREIGRDGRPGVRVSLWEAVQP